jgi:hypothetical protein
MCGGEKFKMAYNIANASMDIAMSGFSPISAIGGVQDAIDIARTIHSAMASTTVSFATWEKSVDDQLQLLGRQVVQVNSDPAGKSSIRPGDEAIRNIRAIGPGRGLGVLGTVAVSKLDSVRRGGMKPERALGSIKIGCVQTSIASLRPDGVARSEPESGSARSLPRWARRPSHRTPGFA